MLLLHMELSYSKDKLLLYALNSTVPRYKKLEYLKVSEHPGMKALSEALFSSSLIH